MESGQPEPGSERAARLFVQFGSTLGLAGTLSHQQASPSQEDDCSERDSNVEDKWCVWTSTKETSPKKCKADWLHTVGAICPIE